MASSTRAAQFIKALTRIVWRVGGRRTSLRLVQCTKVNSGISSTLVFTVIGAHAWDNYHLLKKVDISNTKIEAQEFTFVHCTGLSEVSLPPTLHTMRVKAFMNCAALVELATLTSQFLSQVLCLCPQFAASPPQSPPVPCPQFPVPSSLFQVPCLQFAAPSSLPCPSSLSQFPAPSSLSICCPSSLSQVPCPSLLPPEDTTVNH